MKKVFLLIGLCTISQLLWSQYKYDNASFQTVYIEDLCTQLKNSPGYILLDVRSRGEYNDTSSSYNLNIGHLKNAINIDVNQLPSRWRELHASKDQSIFVYCSHSQRSRRASKMLADSGFTHVINVNGAMTEFNLLKNTSVPCVKDLYQTNNKFNILSPQEVGAFLNSKKDAFVLDLRKDSAFRGIATEERANAYGRLKGSVNIPFAELQSSFAKIPKSRPILVIDEFGGQSSRAAQILTDNGYTNVSLAFNGLDMWVSVNQKEIPNSETLWIHPKNYGLITPDEFNDEMNGHPNVLILDTRTKAEFNNQSKQTWQNRGHVLNAINIPAEELPQHMNELGTDKNKEIIVYAFSNSPESFAVARFLANNGFMKVKVLVGGLWDIRWKAANVKGLAPLMKWVVDVPMDNL